MTKTIRVENADTSDWKVVVQVWDKHTGYQDANGIRHPDQPDTLEREIHLDHPTALTPPDLYITSTRYLVVREAP